MKFETNSSNSDIIERGINMRNAIEECLKINISNSVKYGKTKNYKKRDSLTKAWKILYEMRLKCSDNILCFLL